MTDVRDATHVKVNGVWERIVEKWGIDANGQFTKGGFGVVTETGKRISMWEADSYKKEEAPRQKLEDIELYAWIGEDEFGSGEIGLKQASVPAGVIPMVAIRRDKMEKYWHQAEVQAKQYGKRIYLVRFTYAEVVRHTA